MAAKKLTVETVNQRLRAAKIPLELVCSKVHGNLKLRGWFPEKPEAGRAGVRRQYYRLDARNNPAGLEWAEAEAHRIAALLAQGRFTWDKPEDKSSSCGYWVEKFKGQWLKSQEGTPEQIDLRWRENYWYPAYKWLPANLDLTASRLEAISQRWKANSRSRQKGCQLLQRLADFAGVDSDIGKSAGGYGVGSVQREIPSDSEIEAAIDAIPSRPWQWIAGMMAAFGLRPHEAFLCSLEWREVRGVRFLVASVEAETKTGRRDAVALPARWVERWNLGEVERPSVTATLNKVYGSRTSHQFARYKMPFTAYALRHAWNLRAALDKDLPVAIASQFLGHSIGVNQAIYQRHISEARAIEGYLEAEFRGQRKGQGVDDAP